MDHSSIRRTTEPSSSDLEWPGIAAAAVAWWDESAPAGAPSERRSAGSSTDPSDPPAWPSIAAAACAWWDDAALPTRSVAEVVPANDVQSPAWPEVAAAAGSWWDDALASGVYATRAADAARVA